MKEYLISLDQGTTSSRAILYDNKAKSIGSCQTPTTSLYPHPGWVEQDPMELWSSIKKVLIELMDESKIDPNMIAGIGITNQRETTIVWDKKSGAPIYNAIVWQDRRTADYCASIASDQNKELIRSKTGLIIDAYFSATKIAWILDHVEGARAKAEAGELAFGTVDSWVIWNLSSGQLHLTDVTNASRTMLYNIHSLEWDQELLDLFDIPAALLPQVKSSSEVYGSIDKNLLGVEVPIAAIAGDQQSALFGQLCTKPGMAKTTYGTGCFLVMNTGEKAVDSSNELLTTIAWKIGNQVHYALEGSVFVGGAAIQFLRDGLELISEAKESEALARSVEDTAGVCFVPALTGLGAPHWDSSARGAIFGLTRGTSKAHIVRAALEAIGLQVHDLIQAMCQDTNSDRIEMRVDGGATANNFLMQFQADILNTSIERPVDIETTALGVTFLAGLATGIWKDMEALQSLWITDKKFSPELSQQQRAELLKKWNTAIERSKNWV